MTSPTTANRITLLLGLIFVAVLSGGCMDRDLKGYRKASDTVVAETSSSNNSDQNIAGDVQEPRTPATAAETGLEDLGSETVESLPVSALVPVNVVGGVKALLNASAAETGVAVEDPAVPTTANPGVAKTNEATSATGPRQIEVLVKEKKFQIEPKTGALRVSFDDLDLLKVLNMEPVVENAVELMPDWLKDLNGKSIRLRGFMYPTFETEGIERFVLARDNQICCFGRDPKIYDLVQIDMKAGKTTSYIPATRAFDVVGKFKMEMLSQDGKPYGLYAIEDATVIDR